MIKLFSNKKGQAALEYLVTYGWAFLIILAAIGALSYFGFLNPGKYIPDSCDFGDQLVCHDALIRNDGHITLRLENSFEADINITGLMVDGIAYAGPYDSYPAGNNFVIIKKGEIRQVHFNVSPIFYKGDKERIEMLFTFSRANGGTINHNITGVFRSEVIDSTLS